MNAAKWVLLADALQTTLDFHLHFILGTLAGTILNGFAQGRTGIVPEAIIRRIAVQVRQGGLQRIERIVECCDIFAGLYCAKADS